jgi:hypothetical protein
MELFVTIPFLLRSPSIPRLRQAAPLHHALRAGLHFAASLAFKAKRKFASLITELPPLSIADEKKQPLYTISTKIGHADS